MVVESESIRYEIVHRRTCPRCGYTWDCRSKRDYITCPNCRYPFRPEPAKDEGVEK